MLRKDLFLFALLLLLLPIGLAAQNCQAVLNTPLGVCRYSYGTISAANPVPGATYNWGGSGIVVVQNNGASIRVYFPNMGNHTITLQQLCPLTGAISSTSNVIYVHSGTQPSGYGSNVVDTRDTVLAGTPVNVGYTWNYAPFANHTSGYGLLYPTPTSKFGITTATLPITTSGFHTDSVPQTFPTTYSNGKYGMAITKWNYCSDTVYNFTYVLGALNGPLANCLGDIVNYTLPVGTVNLWTISGGNILSGQGTNTVQVQWTTAGTGTVQCNWTHGAWGTNTTSRNVTVGSNSAPVITGNPVLCASFQQYTVPNVPGHSYRWTVNGVNASTTASVVLISSNQPAYNLVVFDSIGTCVSSASLTVTNPILPHPVISAANGVCQNSPLSMSISGVTGATYTWNTPGATVVSGAGTNSIVVRPANLGYNTFSVTVNVSGCTRTVQKLVDVLPTQTPVLGPDFGLCPGNTATITNSTFAGSFITSYSGGPGFMSGSSINVNGPGTYWMQCTVLHNAATCVTRDTVIVSPSPSVGVDLGPDQVICYSPSTTLTPTFSGSVGPYTYAWSNGATTASIVVGPGTYSVTASATGYCDDADTIVVSGAAMPSVSLPSNSVLCAGASTVLDAGPGYTSYLWSTGATTQSITVTVAGSYSVTATDGLGCQSVSATTLLLVNAPSSILGLDTTICPDTFAVFSSAPFASYLWNTGATTGSVQATLPGTYSISVTDINGCVWPDDVVLSLNTDCIWPGDANHDGVADNADILAIGYALIGTGPVRPSGNTSWYGQTCPNWALSFPSTLNFKHADCDASGLIDNNDTLVVIQNYALTHNKGNGVTTGPALSFVPLQSSYSAGDVVEVGIHLGDASIPVVGTNGVAYSVTIGGITTSPGDVWFTFPQSFLGSPGNYELAVAFEDVAPGRHDIGQSRTGNSQVNGYGQIAVMHIRTDSTMLPLPLNVLTFDFSGALLVGDSLQSLPISIANGGVNVYGAGITGIPSNDREEILVFPIPGDEVLHLQRNLGLENLNVRVYDLAGKLCSQMEFEGLTMDLPVADWSNGTYLLSFTSNTGVVQHKKVLIMHAQ